MPKGERSPRCAALRLATAQPAASANIPVHAPPQVRSLQLPASAAPSPSGRRSTRSLTCAESTASTPGASRRMRRWSSQRCAGPALAPPE
eukprot:scaffold33516_cov59-Phaeocystis_antarctica.AAC.3